MDATGALAGWRSKVCRAIGLAIAPGARKAYDGAVKKFRLEVGYLGMWLV